MQAAESAWGSKACSEAEAEDRLAFACERAPTDDAVTSKLRKAFQAGALRGAPLLALHAQQLPGAGACNVPARMTCVPLLQAMEADYRVVTEREKAEVVELGGLHVIGTERHESRRIDNQLRGRCGRRAPAASRITRMQCRWFSRGSLRRASEWCACLHQHQTTQARQHAARARSR